MRILIRIGGTINKGDEAMLVTCAEELSKRIDGARFLLVDDGSPAHYDVTRFEPMISIIRPESASYRGKILSFLKLALCHPGGMAHLLKRQPLVTARFMLDALPAVAQADAVVDISGYAYSSNWGIGWALRARPHLQLCRWAGKPYLFLPQAWGPFSTKDAGVFREVCEWCARLFVRDAQSGAHVRAIAPGAEAHLGQCPDMAFLFQGADSAFGKGVLESLGIVPGQGPIVGITPNFRIYERAAGQGSKNAYLAFLAETACALVNLGMQVVLIPHEYSNKREGCADDRLLCHIVEDRCASEKVRALEVAYSSRELKGIVANLDALLGSRYHSIIAALSLGIPAMCLGWAHKYDEIAEEFGIPCVRMDAQAPESTVESAVTEVRRAVAEAAEIRVRLEETAGSMKTLVQRMFDTAAATILQESGQARKRT